ncbi:hypothetical protein C5167_035579 [Papaver somniferum]|uniref:Secreted protein n=1 Tax=Papaver somniferum TaxID=3469 RepID=A0A4Y7KHL0_PAPSO|nr:hypothetical protein C5167_035579 [Papaver somniferum]
MMKTSLGSLLLLKMGMIAVSLALQQKSNFRAFVKCLFSDVWDRLFKKSPKPPEKLSFTMRFKLSDL